MAVSNSPASRKRGSLIEAEVISLTSRSTARGDRIYAVFKAVDGSTLGFWSQADHPALQGLRVGDPVTLKRNSKGHLYLAFQPVSYASGIGIFALLQRPWRLS